MMPDLGITGVAPPLVEYPVTEEYKLERHVRQHTVPRE